ncbi:MAG: 50S ribosomal protein L28 [Dehalococcoidia bacterium]|nr:50S ribosomal protein L28 [Dehalococcoidia bacterium]
MAACSICQKIRMVGFAVSHSKRHTKRTWQPNIQRATVYEGGRAKQVYMCTRCLRNQSKVRK